MSSNLRFFVTIVGVALVLITAIILKKGRVPVKYSLIWFFSGAVIVLVGLVPGFLENISKSLGFLTISNMIIGVFIIILLLITMSLTIIVSGQKKKITLLIQEISILKEKYDER